MNPWSGILTFAGLLLAFVIGYDLGKESVKLPPVGIAQVEADALKAKAEDALAEADSLRAVIEELQRKKPNPKKVLRDAQKHTDTIGMGAVRDSLLSPIR